MNASSSNYWIGQGIIIIITFIVIGATYFALRYAYQKLEIEPTRQRKLLRYIGFGLLLWLTILAVLASMGYFADYQAMPPKVFQAFLLPIILPPCIAFSASFRAILKVIPKAWLIYIQSFRIGTELFFWLGYKAGFVPLQMTLEWFNQDIIVGITAPMAGYLFFAKGRFQRFEAFIWNIFGIALLINILAICYFSVPSPARVFLNKPAGTFLVEAPFIWILGFLLPYALAMHIFSLQQIFIFPEKVGRVFTLNRKQ